MRSPVAIVDVDHPATWTRWRRGLCEGCRANCCTMPVEVRLADLLRLGWVDAFEAEHLTALALAKRLLREQRIERFHPRSGLFTLARRADGDCALLDPVSRRCTVYAQRPDTCRLHPQKGPRPGYCPYGPRAGT